MCGEVVCVYVIDTCQIQTDLRDPGRQNTPVIRREKDSIRVYGMTHLEINGCAGV